MIINNATPIKKNIISYDKFGRMMDKLVKVITLSGVQFSCVHGLPRGGLSIAVHLSHHLNIPLIINVKQFINEYDKNSNLLVADDIIDTGRTFSRFLDIATINELKFKTAVLFRKNHANYEPNYYVEETNDWIVFPWENPDERPNREMYEFLGGEISSCDIDCGIVED